MEVHPALAKAGTALYNAFLCVSCEHALLFKYENTPDMICWEKLIMYFVHKILFPYLCGFKDN